MSSYDDSIEKHYNQVAATDGPSPHSTMADEITRQIESDTILDFVSAVARTSIGQTIQLVDVGCGNGYTLSLLAGHRARLELTGIEANAALRAITASRFNPAEVTVVPGDIRQPHFHGKQFFDVLICQRVIVNLLDRADQKTALDNIIAAVRPGGALIFVEAFTSGLDQLNAARSEFDLAPLQPAHHNLYLPDDFFEHPELSAFRNEGWTVSPTALSSHYFVSRVLHAAVIGTRPLKRNSEFVKFLTAALPPAIGNYSPLRIHAFTRS